MKRLIIACLSVMFIGFAVIAADKFLYPLPFWGFALGWALGFLGIVSAIGLFVLCEGRHGEVGIVTTSFGVLLAMLVVLNRKIEFLPELLRTVATLSSLALMAAGVLVGHFKNQHDKN